MKMIQFDDCDFPWSVPPGISRFPHGGSTQHGAISDLDEWFYTFAQTEGWFSKATGSSASGREGTKQESGILLIHANGCFTRRASRQELEGIEILKHIRLTDGLGVRAWHAIVYSFEPLEDILRRKPGSMILLSRGVSFLRLPEALDLEAALRIEHKDDTFTIERLANHTDNRGPIDAGLRPFIASDYRPPDTDHPISNWWGVQQLMRAAEGLNRTSQAAVVPLSVEAELKKIENKKAFFLAREMFRTPRVGATGVLRKLREKFRNNPPVIVYVDDEINAGWKEAMYFVLTGENLSGAAPAWYQTYAGSGNGLATGESDWQQFADDILLRKPSLVITDLRLLGSSEADRQISEISGAKLVAALRERAPAVPILLATASNKAWTLQEVFKLGVDAYWMKEGIGDHAGPWAGEENASELVRVIQKLLGADYQVLRVIDRTINEFVDNCNAADRSLWPWWKEMEWWNAAEANGRDSRLRQTNPDVGDITSLLRNLTSMYREYLRLFTLKHGSKEPSSGKKSTDFWSRPFAVHIGRIIECVHCFDQIRVTIDVPDQRSVATAGTVGGYPTYAPGRSGTVRTMRADWLGQTLYNIRNSAAHFDAQELPDLTKDHVRSLLQVLFTWLSTRPSCQGPPSTFVVGTRQDKPVYPRLEDFFIGVDSESGLVDTHYRMFERQLLRGDLPRKVIK